MRHWYIILAGVDNGVLLSTKVVHKQQPTTYSFHHPTPSTARLIVIISSSIRHPSKSNSTEKTLNTSADASPLVGNTADGER